MKFVHTTINVKDMEESLKFYQKIVGLNIVNQFNAGPGIEIVFLGEEGTKVELISDDAVKEIQIGQDISLGFSVNSLDETLKFIKEKGIKIHSGPFQPNPTTRFFFFFDPNGLKIQFIEQE